MVSRLRQGYWCIAAVQPAHGGRGRTHHRAAKQRLEDVHPHHGMFPVPRLLNVLPHWGMNAT